MLLEVKDITVCYGSVKALENVSLKLNEGEIVAMIGPNGAGKSTTLKAISGLLEATGGHIESGEILFEGKSIKKFRTDELVRKGISLVPEGRRLFSTMTVWENLEMGAYTKDYGCYTINLRKRKEQKSKVQSLMSEVFELFPILYERRKQKAGTLSSGEQQILALGRALMLEPKLLLTDEPSLGLSPNFVDLIFDKLIEINKNGTSILLVEQNAFMALEVCHRGYVFEIGSIVLEGEKEKLVKNKKVKKAYLGG